MRLYQAHGTQAVVLQLGHFAGLLTMGVGVSLTLLPVLGTIFILRGCLIQAFYKVMCLVLLMLRCHIWVTSLQACSFLKGNRGVVYLGKEEVGRDGEKRGWCWDVLYERRIISKPLKFEKRHAHTVKKKPTDQTNKQTKRISHAVLVKVP